MLAFPTSSCLSVQHLAQRFSFERFIVAEYYSRASAGETCEVDQDIQQDPPVPYSSVMAMRQVSCKHHLGCTCALVLRLSLM